MKSLIITIVSNCLIRSVVSSDDSSSVETTLTTAKQRPYTSPKPSTLYRRINVQRPDDDHFSTPLDLFGIREPARRKNHIETVWKWDYWCQLQPKIGNCANAKHKGVKPGQRESFYYDAQLDTCLKFIYSGCDGNKNNFPSLGDCERHCKGASYMMFKEASTSDICELQPNAGLCLDFDDMYYYDVNENKCKTYVYGGCGGNQNRFPSKERCEERCKS